MVVVSKMLFVRTVEDVISTVGMWAVATFMVMAMVMMAMFAVHMFVAVFPFAVVDVFGGSGIGRRWRRGWFIRHRQAPSSQQNFGIQDLAIALSNTRTSIADLRTRRELLASAQPDSTAVLLRFSG